MVICPIHRSSRLFQFYFPCQGLPFGHLKVWGWHPLHLFYLFHNADLAWAIARPMNRKTELEKVLFNFIPPINNRKYSHRLSLFVGSIASQMWASPQIVQPEGAQVPCINGIHIPCLLTISRLLGRLVQCRSCISYCSTVWFREWGTNSLCVLSSDTVSFSENFPFIVA